MKINDVNKVCDVFMPGEERPINRDFTFLGENFWICTYRFMRGGFGLKGDETPRGYFIECASDWLDFHIDAYPECGEYKKKCKIKARARKKMDDVEKYEKLMNEIDAAFTNAVTGTF